MIYTCQKMDKHKSFTMTTITSRPSSQIPARHVLSILSLLTFVNTDDVAAPGDHLVGAVDQGVGAAQYRRVHQCRHRPAVSGGSPRAKAMIPDLTEPALALEFLRGNAFSPATPFG
jgi:hypothetical protein